MQSYCGLSGVCHDLYEQTTEPAMSPYSKEEKYHDSLVNMGRLRHTKELLGDW